MLEQFDHLLLKKPEGIALETRARRSISNLQDPVPSPQMVAIYEGMRSRFGANWRSRRPPTGFYNCAGLVWASRRTAIYDGESWDRVLADDGYREIDARAVEVADLVLYVDPAPRQYLHVASVLNIESRARLLLPVVWVVSKWSAAAGEDVHHHDDVGHLRQTAPNLKIEYWTDRPK